MIARGRVGLLIALLWHVIKSQTKVWDYTTGGMDWPDASNVCGGNKQSPIVLDVNKAVPADEVFFEIEFNNKGVNTTMTTNPHLTFKGEFSYVKFKDTNGTLLEFNATSMHFHAPGEHFINGRLYDSELHIIHQLKDPFKNLTSFRIAMVTVLFEAKENEESLLIKKLDVHIKDKPRYSNLQRDFWNDFKQLSRVLLYEGSLTFPNCDETVYWFVFTTPLPMGISQLTAMDQWFRLNPIFANGRGNNRLMQKLNGRTVTMFDYQQKVVTNLGESAFFDSYLKDLLS
jgi:carbonic anhydrase